MDLAPCTGYPLSAATYLCANIKEAIAMNRLYRTQYSDAVLAGVCGGIARYFNMDSTLIRLIAAVLIFAGGLSLWVYIIAIFIMPKEGSMP